jgi:hypothetical protein
MAFYRCFGLLLTTMVAGCGLTGCVQDPADAPPDTGRPVSTGNDQIRPKYDLSGKLTLLESDRNGDGKVDTWGYMDGSRVVRVEVDENGDGKADRWEYHGAPQPSQAELAADLKEGFDPTIDKIEFSTRFDGKVSRTEYYSKGHLAKAEEDADGDGRIDKWEAYENDALAVLELDTAHRGRPDRRLIYRPDGTLDRIEVDANGTGTFTPQTQ